MGTHPNGPSMVLIEMPWRTITPLIEWLKLNPDMQVTKPLPRPVWNQRARAFSGDLLLLTRPESAGEAWYSGTCIGASTIHDQP